MKYTENKGIGVYTVTFPKSAKFGYKRVAESIHRRYVIDRMQIKIEGEVVRDDAGLWLVSGDNRLQLKNRPKKDEKDAPPDLVARLEEGLKAGKTTVQVEGDVNRFKETTIIHLEAVQAVEKKKPGE